MVPQEADQTHIEYGFPVSSMTAAGYTEVRDQSEFKLGGGEGGGGENGGPGNFLEE